MIQFEPRAEGGFRETEARVQHRPPLKELGAMVTKGGLRVLPGRPAWALPSRAHQPSYEKAVPAGAWARYVHNGRFTEEDRTLYFEWTINVANSDSEPFRGEPAWTIDARVDLS